MKRARIPIPKPRSNFLQVKCSNCGNEQLIFSNSTISIKCRVCESRIAESTGGRTAITGVIVRGLD